MSQQGIARLVRTVVLLVFAAVGVQTQRWLLEVSFEEARNVFIITFLLFMAALLNRAERTSETSLGLLLAAAGLFTGSYCARAVLMARDSLS